MALIERTNYQRNIQIFMKQLTEEHAKFHNTICQYIPEDSLWASFEEALAELDDEQLQDDNSCYLLGYGDENWRDSANHDFQYMIGEALSFASDIAQYFSTWIRSIDTDVPPIMPAHIVDKSNLYLSFILIRLKRFIISRQKIFCIFTGKLGAVMS